MDKQIIAALWTAYILTALLFSKKPQQLYFVGFHMIKKNLHKFKGSAVFILIAGFTGSAAKKLCKWWIVCRHLIIYKFFLTHLLC